MLKKTLPIDDDDYDEFLERAVREYERKVFIKKLAIVSIIGFLLYGFFNYMDINYAKQHQVVEAAQNQNQ